MIRRVLVASAVLLALLLPASPALAGRWESPGFATGSARPAKIVVLPAEAAMTRTRLIDAVPFVKETKLLEDALRSETGAALTGLGYAPDLATLSPEAIAADRELQAMVRDLEEQVAPIIDVAGGKPKDIGRGRFSVGEAVLPLATRTGAEGFLWLMSQSVVPSKGQRTLASVFSVLSGSYGVPTNQTQLVAVLVDARTGDLASVTVAMSGGPVLKDPARVAASVVQDIFKQWPAFSVARKVSEKQLAAAASAVKPAVPGAGTDLEEEALIARFEDADARLQGHAAAGPPEAVVARDEFTQAGNPVAADGAPQAEPVSLFEPAPLPVAAEPRPSAPASAPTTVAAPAPAPATVAHAPRLPDPRKVWDAPPASRPGPSRQIVLQMLEGAPSINVRNTTPQAVLVSVDLGDWQHLAAGESSRFDTGAGSHRILITDATGAELARATVIVSARMANAEIWPF